MKIKEHGTTLLSIYLPLHQYRHYWYTQNPEATVLFY